LLTLSAGGTLYRANSEEQLLAIVSKIKKERIKTQSGTLEIHEDTGVFRAAAPDGGMAFVAGSRQQLLELVGRVYPLMSDSESEIEAVAVSSLSIKETKIPETSKPIFAATIDGICYRADSKEQLVEIISHVHPMISDITDPQQWWRNLVFYPSKYPIE
jgi:hypothetical protein